MMPPQPFPLCLTWTFYLPNKVKPQLTQMKLTTRIFLMIKIIVNYLHKNHAQKNFIKNFLQLSSLIELKQEYTSVHI